ncbi:ribose-5-phosphate isomerase RpiA [Candidatus Aciduliprofundum boonei]|uniref:Ribose-5-phosphate isomerase A n=1 Tax=Aciduliprofundum boonei (strain DSM 19572 / T469) TaxID=439481 RepID=B5IA06_ACIB4|nr:ribose-5-phosphate isomerase RpiA [Candidatus Aciduliprofundum boonei]ADD08359.1 ribose 5-phosphate isomerase [Aciduliprofundum boonei T469]EDY37113.1 ribose 5-phosphate isomerase A [Aciduliprofundum boonei T469]HII54703.1 ribose-5-phosphate isomerase RpiA [Candidatus Aciduliprofundum boonei]
MELKEELKRKAGEKAVKYIKDGMVVGLGTGSTVKYTILKLGELVKDGLDIIGIPTSIATEKLAKEMGIKLGSINDYQVIDLTIDGADEVDRNLNLIKGGGGALLREKMIAHASKYEIIVVDESKVKSVLGDFPLPIEIVKFGYKRTMNVLSTLGCKPLLRVKNGEAYITDNGNYIVDCKFERIDEPAKLERRIDEIPGVVEVGLFVGLANKVIVGKKDKIEIMTSSGDSL